MSARGRTWESSDGTLRAHVVEGDLWLTVWSPDRDERDEYALEGADGEADWAVIDAALSAAVPEADSLWERAEFAAWANAWRDRLAAVLEGGGKWDGVRWRMAPPRMHADCDNRGGACSACRSGGAL